jgi:cell division transport system ATP-binding protein
MQLLYRINRTGSTVVVATHDNAMVDRMRRRVIELNEGRIVRDEAGGLYDARDESTAEFTARLRDEPGSVGPVRAARAGEDAGAGLDFEWSEPIPRGAR